MYTLRNAIMKKINGRKSAISNDNSSSCWHLPYMLTQASMARGLKFFRFLSLVFRLLVGLDGWWVGQLRGFLLRRIAQTQTENFFDQNDISINDSNICVVESIMHVRPYSHCRSLYSGLLTQISSALHKA
jgi:hypothetical protein